MVTENIGTMREKVSIIKIIKIITIINRNLITTTGSGWYIIDEEQLII